MSASWMLLGEDAFNAAWSQGRSLTPEQAIAAQPSLTIPAALEAKQTQASPAPSTKHTVSYPEGLTAREVEVVRLVAKGLTDAQVAVQLNISYRTVSTHLTSVYNKLGINSRVAVVRFAAENKLI